MSIVLKAGQTEKDVEDNALSMFSGNRTVSAIQKKNQIHFSKLAKQIKYLFQCSLRQCSRRNCLREVFHRWNDDQPNKKPVKIQLSNEDGSQLIWRMQKIIQKNKMVEKSKQLDQKLLELKSALLSYEESLKNVLQKEKDLADLQLEQQTKSAQKTFLLIKMQSFQSSLYKKIDSLKEKIQLTQNEILSIKHRQDILFGSGTIMGKILTKTISKQVRHLLKETIIAIVETSHEVVPINQIDNQEVYVIFEQCYSTKKIKKTTIIKYIGSDTYIQKVNKGTAYMSIKQHQFKFSKKINNLMSCHRCMKIYDSKQLNFCSTNIGKMQTNSYSTTDYYTYRKNYLQGDYFYKAEEQHVLPFYLYNNDKGKLACNRGFCADCVNFLFNGKQFSCPYCSGLCACVRCEIAMGIVKLIALDYPSDPQSKKHYHLMLRLFGGLVHPDVSQTLKLRVPSNNDELFNLIKIWNNVNSRLSQLKRVSVKIQLKSCQSKYHFNINGQEKIRWNIILEQNEESISQQISIHEHLAKRKEDEQINLRGNNFTDNSLENVEWMSFIQLNEGKSD